MGLVGDVQFDHRRRLRQSQGDPLHQRHPTEPGEHHGGALLLREAGGVEGHGRLGDHPGDQDVLAGQ